MAGYDFTAIENKWQQYWADKGTFVQPNPGESGFDADAPKMYVLDMFPYPSGAGLHVGHPEGYTATDIVARYWRMRGCNVIHPMGYDAFGLPAEQYAVEHGVHPRETTEKNIGNIERQIKMFGFSYDWSRRVATTDVDYYRWTQWIFLQLYNSWYDPAADAARPISELESKLLNEQLMVDANGGLHAADAMRKVPEISLMVPAAGLIKFTELSGDQQRQLVDEYRLAYMAEVPVNWCPKLGTVLANEEVTNKGRSERGDHPVYRRALKQWMLRITAYAERLLADIETVNWPEPIKIMQRNWIGKSTGANVFFDVAETDQQIEVYTTRPDTLFGATYMVLAPEHPLVAEITTAGQRDAVTAYVEQAARKSELERTADAKDKTGVFTGAYAVNPVNQQQIPIWTADYVMMGYGTGAIMAVPAHDERDFAFAKRHGLPMIPVVRPPKEWFIEQAKSMSFPDSEVLERLRHQAEKTDDAADWQDYITEIEQWDWQARSNNLLGAMRWAYESDPSFMPNAYTGDGRSIRSSKYTGLPTAEFKKRITADLEADGTGRAAVNYKLRDWLFSRQRYWGEPFPIVHCDACGTVPLRDDQLPLELPEMDDFTPAASDDPDALPQPPLGKATEWVQTTCPACGQPATRELNTMPQWAGSCWYYLRYLDPRNSEAFCDPTVERYWMGQGTAGNVGGVDLYVGGAEHAVLHLLYARFWHKVLYDLGHVSTAEPFGKLFNQGMIRSFAYRDARGVYVGYDDVDTSGDTPRQKSTGEPLAESVEKMSKSLKNVVNPDEVIAEYGADTFRLYEMFMGPLEASKPWNTRDVPGVHRFLQRVWRMVAGDPEQQVKPLLADAADESVEKALHKLTKKVGEDVEAMKFNTAIAAMMEFVNMVFKAGRLTKSQAERFVLLLAPLAPHVAEELWETLGHHESLAYEPWPTYDEAMIAETTVELPVQVNGKIRTKIRVAVDASQDEIIAAAEDEPKVVAAIDGKAVVKKIVVPGRLVNLVVK